MKKLVYIWFVMAAMLVSCEREITYHGEYDEPKLVIQAMLRSGADTIDCYVGRSYFFLDSIPQNEEALNGVILNVRTSRGASIASDMVNINTHHLLLTRPMEAGDTVWITASHPKYGVANVTEIIMPPFEPVLKKAIWKKSKEVNENECQLAFQLPEYSYSDPYIGMTCTGYLTSTNILPRFKDDTIERWDTMVVQRQVHDLRTKDNKLATRFRVIYESGRVVNLTMPLYFLYDREIEMKYKDIEYVRYVTYSLDSIIFKFEVPSSDYQLYGAAMNYYSTYNPSDSTATTTESEYEEQMAMFSNVEGGFGAVISKTTYNLIIKQFE